MHLSYQNFFSSILAHFDAKEAGDMSTLFDVGGILGRFSQNKELKYFGISFKCFIHYSYTSCIADLTIILLWMIHYRSQLKMNVFRWYYGWCCVGLHRRQSNHLLCHVAFGCSHGMYSYWSQRYGQPTLTQIILKKIDSWISLQCDLYQL